MVKWDGHKLYTTKLYQYKGWYGTETDYKLLFEYCVNETSMCCGIREYHEFYTHDIPRGVPVNAIKKAVKERWLEDAKEDKFGFIHLTILHNEGNKPWFLSMLRQWKGAKHTDWHTNPNTGNKLQFWVLPV